MSYPILDPKELDLARRCRCALAVMAKAPRPGRVKTRLCPPLTSDQSAALNICFLRDTTENLGRIAASGHASGIVSYTPVGDEALFDGLLPEGFTLIAQRGEDFGERLLASAEDILSCGFGSVCLIDSDSPTVPAAYFQQAVADLGRPGDRIVLGPAHDGGYYLIGLKHPHSAPFQKIHWSTSTVLEETVAAAESAGIEVVQLPPWYDVDDPMSLDLLEDELLRSRAPMFAISQGYRAEHSREFLRALRAAPVPV